MFADALGTIPLFTPVMIGLLTGVLSSLFGISGGVIGVPLMILAGVPPHLAVGSQAPAQLFTTAVGLRGYQKKGEVDFVFAGIMLSGGLIALALGSWIYQLLQATPFLPYVIKGLYMLLMTVIGGGMLVESIGQILRNRRAEEVRSKVMFKVEHWPLQNVFRASGVSTSLLVVFGLGFVAGLMSALMGTGGGFFLVPAMMYVMSMTARMSSGTSLAYTFATAIVTTCINLFSHHSVDPVLSGLMIVGGVAGARLGLFIVQYVRGAFFRMLLGFFIFGVGMAIAVQSFLL